MSVSDYTEFIKSNITVVILGLCVAIFLASKSGFFGFGSLPNKSLAAAYAAQADPCESKERCILAYLAPWCPSCVGSAGFLKSLKERTRSNSMVGMKIIIGMDSEDKLLTMAENFGSGVYLDPDGTYADELGIRGVPSVLVADKNNKILEKGLPGALRGNNEEESIEYYIDNYLGLRTYFNNSEAAT